MWHPRSCPEKEVIPIRPFEITILSGKGGTGKTTIAAAFIDLSSPKAIAVDLDVDASNLHLLMKLQLISSEPFFGLDEAVIDEKKCVRCGACVKVCRFNAIDDDINVIKEKCEGCGACEIACPHRAITMVKREEGTIVVSDTPIGKFVHSNLRPGGEGSGKLVNMLRSKAKELAVSFNKELIITDGPPGIGCPVISSLTGTDLSIIVTEPSVSGLSDLSRILELSYHFNIESLVIVNKFDIDTEITSKIEELVSEKGSRVIGKVPFDRTVYDTLQEGETIVACDGCAAGDVIREIWKDISDHYIN